MTLLSALTLQLGYNASLVTIGAALLGIAAGVGGTFLFLRKRALVSDAISHATLPGVGLAFIVAVALGGDGRNLLNLMIGAALSAGLGLACVSWLSRQTRLGEDAAIGAVLSVFFGFGVVLLTVIQSLETGQQAGLEGFLLGSTAGMLRGEALMLAICAWAVLVLVLLLRRPMTLAAFDPGYAEARGVRLSLIDAAMMGIVLVVTVVGLKIVGLILIVALLIIPPVTARFWTNQIDRLLLLAGLVGGMSGWIGAALSATAPDLPTGPVIVLVCFAIFLGSFIFSPLRGVMSSVLRYRHFRVRVHLRQGLLAMAQGQPIYEGLTMRLLKAEGLVRPDGVATNDGKARAAKALRDEHRWAAVRADANYAVAAEQYDGLTPIETVLTRDEIQEIDERLETATVI